MDNETAQDFAKYRLTRAKETLNTAVIILDEVKDYTSVNNKVH